MADFQAVLKPVKKHPLLIGGVVIGGAVLLFIYMRGGFGGGQAAVASGASGPSQADLAYAAQGQQLSYQAAMQGSAQQFQLAYLQQEQAGSASHDAVQAQLETLNISSSLDLAKFQTNAAQTTALASMQQQLDIATLGANTQTELARLGAATQLGLTQITSQTQLGLAQDQANIVAKTLDTQLGMTAQNVQLQENLASKAAETQVSLAQISAGVQKKQSSNSLIGGIIGGVLSIFSDENLKRDIALLYRRNDGVGVYRYRYRDGDAKWYRGLIAQDVALIYPEHVVKEGDFFKVNYDALWEREEIMLAMVA
jgi:hypothetical protein